MMNQAALYPRKNFPANKFQSDPQNSTYRWELYLTPGYPGNKVDVMDGYSKGQGAEHPNKLTLLCKKLSNPILPYLSRCTGIVIYEQNAILPKNLHKEILVLGRDNFFPKQEWVAHTPSIMEFLTEFYAQYRQSGQMPAKEDRRKNVRQWAFFPDLDHSKYTFRNLIELQKFCDDRVATYSRRCMLEWFNVHAQFQPELFETNDREEMTHAVHTATSAEQAQALIDEMQRKFTRKI